MPKQRFRVTVDADAFAVDEEELTVTFYGVEQMDLNSRRPLQSRHDRMVPFSCCACGSSGVCDPDAAECPECREPFRSRPRAARHHICGPHIVH